MERWRVEGTTKRQGEGSITAYKEGAGPVFSFSVGEYGWADVVEFCVKERSPKEQVREGLSLLEGVQRESEARWCL